MLKQVNAGDLDDVHFRLVCAASMINAVHSAMTSGDFETHDFTDALYGAYDYLYGLVEELKTLYVTEE